jgi:hypothetical protein
MIREQGLAVEDKLATLEVVVKGPFAAAHMQQDLLCFPRRVMVLYFQLGIQEGTGSNLVCLVAHLDAEDLMFVD